MGERMKRMDVEVKDIKETPPAAIADMRVPEIKADISMLKKKIKDSEK